MKSLVLIGPRGSGKTSVGKELSVISDLSFVDADVEFFQRHGTITDLVNKYGWEEFRRLETELIADICTRYQHSRIVFAPGGGAVAHKQGEQYRNKNVRLLRERGIIFYLLPHPDLRQSAVILTTRVQKDTTSVYVRPSLTGNSHLLSEMLLTLEQRHPLYQATAHYLIYTEGKPLNEVAKDILITYKPHMISK